jgi:intracellular sulfur oxidation DsrE/DsrF family protein
MKLTGHAFLATTFFATTWVTVSAAALAGTDPSSTLQPWQTPSIVGVGKIIALPASAYQPSPAETYSVVFSIAHAAQTAADVNPGLRKVARLVNLYTAAGVPLSHLRFVVVINEDAIDATLEDTQYRQKYGMDNPNLTLVQSLRNAGIDIAVSGQALARGKRTAVDPAVTVALSGMVTLTELQHQGYVLITL